MKPNVMVVGDMTSVQMMFRQRGWNVLYTSNLKDTPDLLCFTGGMDISPSLYGEEPLARTHVHHPRDKQDIEAFQKWSGIPKVGICRGGQLLNVLSGGALWQHVTDHTEDHFVHDLLFKNKLHVTSTHHQMMIPGPNAVILAISTYNRSKMYLSDDPKRKPPKVEPEVIWYEGTNALCFQPHPEARMFSHQNNECREYFFKLIDYFI